MQRVGIRMAAVAALLLPCFGFADAQDVVRSHTSGGLSQKEAVSSTGLGPSSEAASDVRSLDQLSKASLEATVGARSAADEAAAQHGAARTLAGELTALRLNVEKGTAAIRQALTTERAHRMEYDRLIRVDDQRAAKRAFEVLQLAERELFRVTEDGPAVERDGAAIITGAQALQDMANAAAKASGRAELALDRAREVVGILRSRERQGSREVGAASASATGDTLTGRVAKEAGTAPSEALAAAVVARRAASETRDLARRLARTTSPRWITGLGKLRRDVISAGARLASVRAVLQVTAVGGGEGVTMLPTIKEGGSGYGR